VLATALATLKNWRVCRSYPLQATKGTPSRSREKRQSLSAGCSLVIGAREQCHTTDTEEIYRAGAIEPARRSTRLRPLGMTPDFHWLSRSRVFSASTSRKCFAMKKTS